MPWSNVSLVVNSRDRTSGSYADATYNARNQNMVQGAIHSVALSEVNFPYDIPNVQQGFNYFELIGFTQLSVETVPNTIGDSQPGYLQVALAPGFYGGVELATAINDQIAALQISFGLTAADAPTFTYDDVGNRFFLSAPTNVNTAFPSWLLRGPYTFNKRFSGIKTNKGKDLLSIMGYVDDQPLYYPVTVSPTTPGGNILYGQSAPLTFTQYVDICSPQLCKYQDFAGGSSTDGAANPVLTRRGDVVCRLYIANNVALSVAGQEGTRPLVINRQYQNARIMKWTAGNSIGMLDLQLYDDVGQPLQYTWIPRDYQLTFNVYETTDEPTQSESIIDSITGNIMYEPPKKHGSYRPKNLKAWESSTYPISGTKGGKI